LAVLLDGFLTGLILQAAIGPVFFFILNTAIQKTVLDGLLAVLAVTLGDSLYILLAVTGVGTLLQRPKTRLVMQIVSSVILAGFGVMMIVSAARGGSASSPRDVGEATYLTSFVSALILTLANPLTIVFWTSLFAAKAIEKGYEKKQLIPFGLGAVSSTAVFLGLTVLVFSLLRSSVPSLAVRIVNVAVGAALIAYGAVRFVKGTKKNHKANPWSVREMDRQTGDAKGIEDADTSSGTG